MAMDTHSLYAPKSAATTDDPAWKELIPGTWERPLGLVETGMSAVLAGSGPPKREFILIHNVAYFDSTHATQDICEAFQEAWIAFRLLVSPDIATTFHDGKKFYGVPDSNQLQNWVRDTLTVCDFNTSINDAVRHRQARPTYLPTCYLVPHTKSTEPFKGAIILFISHWRTEASGGYLVINQLLEIIQDLISGNKIRKQLDNHNPGEEVDLLTPVLDDIVKPIKEVSPEAKARVAADYARYYSHLPPVEYPMSSEGGLPLHMKVEQRTYTSATTDALVKFCKMDNISITAAVHAAYNLAVWDLAEGENKTRSYACMMPAQVRTRLPPDSPYRSQGCWDSARMLLLTAPPGLSFLEHAHHLKSQYARAASREWVEEDILEIPRQAAQPPDNLPTMPTSQAWFTSVGVLDRDVICADHGPIQVRYLTFWADSMGPGIVLRVWTFLGRMNIQIQWNEAFHSDSLIKQTLDLIDSTLSSAMGKSLDIERRDVEFYNE